MVSGDAEQKLIGLLLLKDGTEIVREIRHVINRGHFAIELFGEVWAAAIALVDAGREPLVEYIVPLVADATQMEQEDVSLTLLSSMDDLPTGSVPHDYAASVVRQWQRRELTKAAMAVIRNLGTAGISTDAAATELARVAVEVRDSIVSNDVEDDGTFRVDDDEIENQTDLPAISTMIADLDAILDGGFRRKDLVVIGARASAGKSSLCTQILMGMAGSGHFLRYYFYEMDKRRIRSRLMAQSDLSESDEMDREYMKTVPIRLIAASGWSVERIESDVRQAVRKHGASVIAVDHLHLMIPGVDSREKQGRYAAITGQLASLAQQLDICVILVAQFNRNVEKRETGTPMMSDFREAGSIEQDASVLLAIERQTVIDPKNPGAEKDAVIHVLKNRYGECATLPMEFDGERSKYKPRLPEFNQ